MGFRCACKCPEAAWFDIDSSWEERKIYINSSVEAADCDCEHVVVPLLKLDVEMAEKFCPRCLCKAETRSVLTIKVVVGLIIWVLALLLIYLGYLVCLEPLLTGSPRPRATGQYRHHQVLCKLKSDRFKGIFGFCSSFIKEKFLSNWDQNIAG